MSAIDSDLQFRRTLDSLSPEEQRELGGRLVSGLLSLTRDERVGRALGVAMDANLGSEVLKNAQNLARTAALDAHARCGADGDWSEQADYFIARAAMACLMEPSRKPGKSPVWQAAVNCRMASACAEVDDDEALTLAEIERQHKVLDDFLMQRGG